MGKLKISENITIFLKGVLMGVCDVIPGISGGTIAFITGIYSRLINAVKNISPKLAKSFFIYIISKDAKQTQELKNNIRNLDLGFLVILGLGIASAILSASRLIDFLLKNYFAYTISFFIGLIVTSSKIIYNNIQEHRIKNISFGFLGMALGIILSLVVPLKVIPDYRYVFLGGFLSIIAMLLPGISGAFILLIMGLYEFIIESLHHFLDRLPYLAIFIIGVCLGAFTASRIITFFLTKYRSNTLYILLGLVLGSLSVPIRKILTLHTDFTLPNILLMFIIFGLGVVSVVTVRKIENLNKLSKQGG